jgi:cytochrome subunit of sulfide dehydrogenase
LIAYIQIFAKQIQRRSMHRKITSYLGGTLCSASLLLCAAYPAHAQNQQNQEQLNIKALAATCANCHGTNGKAVEGSAVVSLTGVPKDYIITQMQAFKSGARPATIMHQISKGYSDAQIEQVATYFAAQKK